MDNNICNYCRKVLQPESEDNDITCTGVQKHIIDPYQSDVYGETVYMWLCPGREYERRMDI